MSTTPIPTIDDQTQRIIDGMIAAESRHLSRRAAEKEACECKDGMFPSRATTNRRNFLFAAGSSAGVGAAVLVAGSAVFKGGKYKENIAAIRNAAALARGEAA